MPLNTDRLFRRIWLANGIVLLLLMIGALVLVGFSFFEGRGPPGIRPTANGKVPAADVRPRAIRYDQPEPIRNSRSALVRVRYGTDYSERSSASIGLSSQHYERAYNPGLIVNVIFLPRDGGPGRLLLERAAFIQDLDFPREGRRDPDIRSLIRSPGSPTPLPLRTPTTAVAWITRMRRSSTSVISTAGTSAGCSPLGLTCSQPGCFRTGNSSFWHWMDGMPREEPPNSSRSERFGSIP